MSDTAAKHRGPTRRFATPNEPGRSSGVGSQLAAAGGAGSCSDRQRELSLVAAAYERASCGEPAAFIAVTGRPGIGKSTLLSEAQRALQRSGATVLAVHCQPGWPALEPLRVLLTSALARLCAADGAAQLVDAATHLLAEIRSRGLGGADDEWTAVRSGLFDRVARLLGAMAAKRPLVVMLHDLDRADAATQQLVLYLARVLTPTAELAARGFRGLLVASARQLEPLRAAGGGLPDVQLLEIELDGLSLEGVRQLLSSDRIVSRVAELTGGDPLAIEALAAGTALRWRTDRDPAAPPADGSAPYAPDDAGIDAPVAAAGRRSGYSRDAERVLHLVAVVGQPLGPETLRLLTRVPHGALQAALAELVEAQVLQKVVVAGELRLSFARAGLRDELLERLPARARRVLHREVAEYLRERGDEADVELLAHHLLEARAGNRAVDAALRAGRRLQSLCCGERAAELYELALEQASGPVERRELHERLVAIYRGGAQLQRAVVHAEALLELQPLDRERVAFELAELHVLGGDIATARRSLQPLTSRGGPALEQTLQARVCWRLAEAHLLCGDLQLAEDVARRGLAVLNRAAPEGGQLPTAEAEVELKLRNCLTTIHLEAHDRQRAGALIRDNLQRAEQLGLVGEQVRVLIQLGWLQLGDCDYGVAEQSYERARQLARGLGGHRLEATCWQHLGVLHERRRQYREAVHAYQRAVDLWKRAGHRSYLGWVALDLAKLYLDLGDAGRATAMVSLAERLADESAPLTIRINLELLRGRIARQRGRFREAVALLDSAAQMAEEAGQRERQTRCRLYAVELFVEREELVEARRQLDELELPDDGRLRLEADLIEASLQERAGDLDRAAITLQSAVRRAEQLDDPEAAWRAHFLQAGIARRRGDEGEGYRLLRVAMRIQQRVTFPEELREVVGAQPMRVALERELQRCRPDVGGSVRGEPSDRPETPPPRPQISTVTARRRFAEIVGEDDRMLQVLAQVQKVAPTTATVLIRGESGTGKELIADAIHRHSDRRDRPMVKVNCGALVESLLLSELFGHEQGAFTGATRRSRGRFERAHGGTIFLDEIGDICPRTQVALLRVLQHRRFERVGGVRPIDVDVRIIFATNCDLEKLVAEGRFREDLYYRIRGVQLTVPPLRDRAGDIPLLAQHILAWIARESELERVPQLAGDALDLLCGYGWPGNVRELENVLRSVSLMAPGPVLRAEDFADYPELQQARAVSGRDAVADAASPDVATPAQPASSGTALYRQLRERGASLRQLKKDVEAACIRQALDGAAGNITHAARLLKMKRPRLSQLIKEHGIDVHAISLTNREHDSDAQ